jgi:hypothetical protein
MVSIIQKHVQIQTMLTAANCPVSSIPVLRTRIRRFMLGALRGRARYSSETCLHMASAARPCGEYMHTLECVVCVSDVAAVLDHVLQQCACFLLGPLCGIPVLPRALKLAPENTGLSVGQHTVITTAEPLRPTGSSSAMLWRAQLLT